MALPTPLQNLIDFIRKNFPDVELDPARIQGFADELERGDGRTMEKLRSDILEHMVGDERIRTYVQKQFDDRGLTYDDARLDRITGEFLTDGRSFKEFGETLDKFVPDTAEESADGKFLDGGQVRKVVNNGGQDDYYVITYEHPPGSGNYAFYVIGNQDKLDAIGSDFTFGPDILDEDEMIPWLDGGDVNEVLNIEGTWAGFYDDAVRDAGIAAGITDPTRWGDAVKDPDIAKVLADAAMGDWTDEQYLAALRNQPYYYETLYPGIQFLYEGSTSPEADYAMYTQNVDQTLKQLGIAKDADGTYGSQYPKMLEAGITDTQFATFGQVYKQAQTNIGFADSLNKWTSKYTGASIESFEDYFDVLAGNAPAEILEIAEIAGLQYMADNQGFQITDQELELLGADTGLDQAQAGQLFSSTSKALLALGDSGLRRGGLSSNDILQAQAGIGGNSEAIKLRMSKLARELGIEDDPTAAIFTDFNREGAPIKKGLESTISEGA